MTLRQFLLACRYRWRTPLLVWAAAVLAGLLVASFVMPPQYRASAELLIHDEPAETAAAGAQAAAPNRLATQADVVRSERVMLRAIRAMGLQERQDLRERWSARSGGQGDFDAWLVERLQRKTDVRPARDSRVLYVSHSAPDARFAADFVNALVKAYSDTALELRMEPSRQYSAFYEERVRQSRDRLRQAQQQSSEFNRRNGITTTDEKLDVEDARLADISTQVVGLQARAAEAHRRQLEAAANPSAMEDVLKDPTVAALAAAIALQETRHQEIGERLGTRHPQVLESQSAVAALTARLESAKRRAAAAFQGGNNVIASQLSERTRALEAQREKVLQRREVRDQARLLHNDVELAQREYDATVARLSKATLETNVPQANVSVLKPATVPSLATSGARSTTLGVAAVGGLLLALLALLVLEARDRRLRDADDVQSRLQQPVLAVLKRRRPRAAASRQRQLPAAPRSILPNERLHAAQ
jgi:chain length determinant protein EpsF